LPKSVKESGFVRGLFTWGGISEVETVSVVGVYVLAATRRPHLSVWWHQE